MKREMFNVKSENARSACGAILLLAVALCLSTAPVFAQTAETKNSLSPPQDLRVFDTPSDGGGSLTVLWSPAPYDSAAARYQVLLSEGTAVADPAAMKVVADFPANQHRSEERRVGKECA